ncbi:hypothetical protein BJ508DRAFT_111709 [Ascobolus immersus RN42]|uniref:protein-ribulosamine 3-kinase n=1 Tax=Ascobolus immersus RN42 TaxID=1160509 RepID=A0A3N4I840_ASCIM|nr:hypothetical protein BJ508DRAFT_111709 [Ascobolus immersus RN42]
MICGEMFSMTLIHRIDPELCPKPLAYGMVSADTPRELLPWGSDTAVDGEGAFLICEFVSILHHLGDGERGMPENTPQKDEIMGTFCKKLAAIHKSDDLRPEMFGFNLPTYIGLVEQEGIYVTTCCWADYFGRAMDRIIGRIKKGEYHCPEGTLRDELLGVYTKFKNSGVIETLLKNLKTPNGVPIQPSLVHGDLWCGNTGLVEDASGSARPIVFDAGCFYGHNEYVPSHLPPSSLLHCPFALLLRRMSVNCF